MTKCLAERTSEGQDFAAAVASSREASRGGATRYLYWSCLAAWRRSPGKAAPSGGGKAGGLWRVRVFMLGLGLGLGWLGLGC